MNINATLFVQAGNFFIAYLLFRYIFLKPAYEALKTEDAQRHSLEDTVAHDKRSVEEARNRQRQAWRTFSEWCMQYLPSLRGRASFFKGISSSLSVTPPSKEEEQEVRKKMVGAMEQAFKERYEQ